MINEHYLSDEAGVVQTLIERYPKQVGSERVRLLAARLIEHVRANPEHLSPLDKFLTEFKLDDEDGVALMCLAESLLRIPDADTADALIADKLSGHDWARHLGHDDLFVNASTWALMLTGQLLPSFDDSSGQATLTRLLGRLGEPVIRTAMQQGMRIIAQQFIMGTDIASAVARSAKERRDYECFSYDMLGEAAITQAQADGFFNAYLTAIQALAESGTPRSGISVKLSALDPRFEVTHYDHAVQQIGDRLITLCEAAASHDVPLTIDAEESDRLEMTVEILSRLLRERGLNAWNGLGIAIQAYQKRAPDVIAAITELAQDRDRRLQIRLVKGAYWDTEIKLAQTRALGGYPVFTRKCHTDISYLTCAAQLLEAGETVWPQFATHNAHTVAAITELAGHRPLEFQRLHGMGEALYEAVRVNYDGEFQCRVYSPVGTTDVLLPYLVRRLLENGANSSFVHRIADPATGIECLTADPVDEASSSGGARHSGIQRPADLYAPARVAAPGFNFGDRRATVDWRERIEAAVPANATRGPVIADYQPERDAGLLESVNPAQPSTIVGRIAEASAADVSAALDTAQAAFHDWQRVPAETRATLLEQSATALLDDRDALLAHIITETGRTLLDAEAELREAVDFLRYYAAECRRLLGGPATLPGPVGEDNQLSLEGRGVFVAISPWNFPLAIFVGQIAAALAAGNTVIAKPAEQASLTALRAIDALLAGGIPAGALSLLPGDGPRIGAQLFADARVSGVAFTGSTEVARIIAGQLARKPGAAAVLIAETGGMNCMIAGSSALPEQVVGDVLQSAFNSAGQRCSALRVLYVQDDIADEVSELIFGATETLSLGDPIRLDTDIGPVIDAGQRDDLRRYVDAARRAGKVRFEAALPDGDGYFVAPTVIEIDHIDELPGEVFGPILHVRRYPAAALDEICEEINSTGYGLTCGIHSRVNQRVDDIVARIRAGNIYVNRNMIGAVVGTQPFGGMGLSGTGPKAGGPHYLLRFCHEQTVTVNTAAVGGNASLFALDETETPPQDRPRNRR